MLQITILHLPSEWDNLQFSGLAGSITMKVKIKVKV